MSDTQLVGLTDEQRNLLLQGLRFVRSSVLLEISEPGSDVSREREQKLQEIASLVDQLNGSQTTEAAAQR